MEVRLLHQLTDVLAAWLTGVVLKEFGQVRDVVAAWLMMGDAALQEME